MSPALAYALTDEPLPLDFEEEEPAPEPCAFEIRHATYYDPPEFCEEDALPGSEFCAAHDPDAYDDYLEERAERLREDMLYGA